MRIELGLTCAMLILTATMCSSDSTCSTRDLKMSHQVAQASHNVYKRHLGNATYATTQHAITDATYATTQHAITDATYATTQHAITDSTIGTAEDEIFGNATITTPRRTTADHGNYEQVPIGEMRQITCPENEVDINDGYGSIWVMCTEYDGMVGWRFYSYCVPGCRFSHLPNNQPGQETLQRFTKHYQTSGDFFEVSCIEGYGTRAVEEVLAPDGTDYEGPKVSQSTSMPGKERTTVAVPLSTATNEQQTNNSEASKKMKRNTLSLKLVNSGQTYPAGTEFVKITSIMVRCTKNKLDQHVWRHRGLICDANVKATNSSINDEENTRRLIFNYGNIPFIVAILLGIIIGIAFLLCIVCIFHSMKMKAEESDQETNTMSECTVEADKAETTDAQGSTNVPGSTEAAEDQERTVVPQWPDQAPQQGYQPNQINNPPMPNGI